MKIYLKSGRKIRVSNAVAVQIMKAIVDGKDEIVYKHVKITKEVVELYRIDQIAAVK